MYRILIVEDNEIIARSLKKHLESWDYDVVCVEDFSDIMKEFAGAAPQLVLMDIEMPVMTGLDAAAIIHEALPETQGAYLEMTALCYQVFGDEITL